MSDDTSAAPEQEAFPAVSLRVSEDRMQVLLSCPPPTPAPPGLVILVEEGLKALAFPRPPQRNAWEPLVIEAAMLPEIVDVPILEGRPATAPRHGYVEWVADFFSVGFVIDPQTGRMNYRQHAAQLSVERGQLLGRIIPPVEGQEGEDVLGRRIPTEKARPARVRAGANVRLDEAEGALYAEATGRIRLKDGVLTVDQVVTIEGSVGLQTGDIRHPGALVVRGDVQAESVIDTTGHVEIMGLMEPATLRTDGDLLVHGGITGADDKRIVVGGAVRAKFILDATIDAAGPVVVESEIVQSNIRTRGPVSCVRGRIVGGKVQAMGGIEVLQTGSAAGVPTLLAAGVDFELAERLESCEQGIAEWRGQRDRIRGKMEPLLERLNRLDPRGREMLKKLETEVAHIEQQVAAIQEEKKRLQRESCGQCRPQIYVYGTAHPETFVIVGEEKTRLTEDIDGPVCIEAAGDKLRMRELQAGERPGNLLKDGAQGQNPPIPGHRP